MLIKEIVLKFVITSFIGSSVSGTNPALKKFDYKKLEESYNFCEATRMKLSGNYHICKKQQSDFNNRHKRQIAYHNERYNRLKTYYIDQTNKLHKKYARLKRHNR